MNTTKTTPEENAENSIEAIEARNVIDGLKLIKHIQATGKKNYPFGFATGTEPDKVPAATTKEQSAIDEEVDRVLDINDAISDIVMAESVYQVVQGNIERAAGNAEAFSKGMYPPEIEVVQTPRSGITLTHRVAVQLDPDADPTLSPNSVGNMTARAKADASLNKWLSSMMPEPKNVGVWVKYKDPSMSGEEEKLITQEQLGLQSTDLLYILQTDTEQSQTEIDDRIIHYVKANHNAHPYAEIKIEYTRQVDPADLSKVSFFELGALTKSLRTIVVKSRHLHGGDHALPQEAKGSSYSYKVDELNDRVKNATDDLDGFTATLTALETDTSDIDVYAAKVRDEFLEIAYQGIQQANIGFITQGIHDIYDAVFKKLTELLKRWKDKETQYATIIAGYNAAGDTNEMFELLRKAEKIISSTLTEPLPADHTIYKTTIIDVKKNAFDAAHNALKPLVKSNKTKLTTYFSDVEAALPAIQNFDAAFFDTKSEKNDIQKEKDDAVKFRDEIKKSVTRLKEDIAKRVADANKIISDIVKEKTDEKKIEMLLRAAKQVLGDDAILVPQYTLTATLADELGNSVTDSTKLLDFIEADEKIADPVEHWFYGTARVRSKMYHLENAAMLIENFKPTARFNLTPLQLPYKSNDRWLAMKFRTEKNPEKFVIGSDTLLYTVHYAVPFNKLKPQCGILVDEWTEVIPAKEETTGITFHYGQPNTEPPQVMLVAVPPKLTGKWHWNDLIDTIHETMDMAKKRAVEPAQIETTAYAQFLPTTMMAVTLYLITLSTNLAINNAVYEKI